MATLLSMLLGCDIDRRAVNPILTQLSEKYGKTFTVTTLGDRIGKSTATAYVIAEDDPDMRFTARVDTDGHLVFEDYAARTVCRQVEDMVAEAFAVQGIDAVCYVRFTPFDNDIAPGTSPADYIRAKKPEDIFVSLLIRDTGDLSAKAILDTFVKIQEQTAGTRIVSNLHIVSSGDYDCLFERIRMETQAFGTDRLLQYGAKDPVCRVSVQITDGIPSKTVAELEAILLREWS